VPAARIFVERSPFVCVATSDGRGNCDVSPRGDPGRPVAVGEPREIPKDYELVGMVVDSVNDLARDLSSGGGR